MQNLKSPGKSGSVRLPRGMKLGNLGESREVKGEPYAKGDTELARRLLLLHEAALVFPRNVHV